MGRVGIPTTSTLLLKALKDPAQDSVWKAFDCRYRPVIASFGRRLGLNRTEADEAAQDTLVEFVRAYRLGRYDRTRGRLSSWIISIARNRIAHRRRALGRAAGNRGVSALGALHGRERVSALWAKERAQTLLARAIDLVRNGKTSEVTWRAFELVALRSVPADQAAKECGITVAEVYVAKNRVASRLREVMAQLKASSEDRT